MRLVDIYPAKGMYHPGEMIRILVKVQGESAGEAILSLSIYHLVEVIDRLTFSIIVDNSEDPFACEWQAPFAPPRGYGLTAELRDLSGSLLDTLSTAFDTLTDWTEFPRYGFLTDFTANRSDIVSTLETLTPFHINGLQFYDWQYRHDKLLPPRSEYIDPLGRALSLDTVRTFIEVAHDRGMAAMPYLVVYAASLKFWQAHKDWALYDALGQPLSFEAFLGLMDPTPGSPWIEHLLGECGEVLAALPFDGLHVDQYGHPREGFNSQGIPVDIPGAFTAFIHALKEYHPSAAVALNAVSNWPIEALIAAPQDFVYIEIWPPDVHYSDLQRIVTNARFMSDGKPVVIALYLPGSHQENIRLADALIFSLGGSRIELGERERLLVDPYFPKHQGVPPELKMTLRRYYDFAVRFGELIGPAAQLQVDCIVTAPPGVWVVARSSGTAWFTICLINLSGLSNPRWDVELPAPRPQTAVSIKFDLTRSIHQAWWAAPDHADLGLAPLSWTVDHEKVSVVLPKLDHWAIIAFELEPSEYASDD